MANLVPLLCVLWPLAQSPSSAVEVLTAIETVLGDTIEKAEAAVVAIARIKGEEGAETLAVRGRNPARVLGDPRVLVPQLNLGGGELVSFDYGSGVVIGDAGEILTAFHVVKGAERLEVRAADQQAFEAEIIAADPRSDLAVIVPREIAGIAAPKLKPLRLGDSSRLRKGAFLIALGNSFNAARDGRPSASWGILANVSRRFEPSFEELQTKHFQLRHYPTLLQLDAKLNLGMSGGAVIDLRGELVGVTTALASAAGFDAMAGYAIPMDDQGRRIVEALKQGKEYEYGFLGVSLDPSGTNRVKGAHSGTPADLGNILLEDQILAVDGMPVVDADSLVLAINRMPAGSQVVLKILRQDQVIERTVELAKFKVGGDVIATNRAAPWRGMRVDYTSMQLNPPATDLGGVIVTEVESESAAAKSGLKRGQVLRAIDGKKLKNPRDFAHAVAGRKGPVTFETDVGAVTVK